MNLWRWFLRLFGRQAKTPPPEPRVSELQPRTRYRRRFHVETAAEGSYDVLREFCDLTGIHRFSPALDEDGQADTEYVADSISVLRSRSNPHLWQVMVEYRRDRTDPDDLEWLIHCQDGLVTRGEPVSTDALRQLCAGAGTDGAVVFTSEGGFRFLEED